MLWKSRAILLGLWLWVGAVPHLEHSCRRRRVRDFGHANAPQGRIRLGERRRALHDKGIHRPMLLEAEERTVLHLGGNSSPLGRHEEEHLGRPAVGEDIE